MRSKLTKAPERAEYSVMERDDRGFTLIELMVVVLIIAILLAIAIPTYFGARQRANDKAAQSNLRNALTNQLVVYSDNQGFTQDTALLAAVDASLTYTNSAPTMVATSDVYVEVNALTPRTVVLGSRSKGGNCFWIRNVGDSDLPRFAANDCSTVPATFKDNW